MTPLEIRTAFLRARSARVRIYYLTSALPHDGQYFPVMGVGQHTEETHVSAHMIARVISVLVNHVVVQADNLKRPVAIRLTSVRSVANLLFDHTGLIRR